MNIIEFPRKQPRDGDTVRTYGTITDLRFKETSNGTPWARFILTGRPAGAPDLLVLAFPQVFTAFGSQLAEDATVEVTGRYTSRDGEAGLYMTGTTRLGATA